jgi:hypothetical protein
MYYLSTNEIVLYSLRPDVLVHELLHAFRDDLIIVNSVYEEGMVRAAEVAVMSSLPAIPGYMYWNLNHSYTYDRHYELYNHSAISCKGGLFGMGLSNSLILYEQAGTAWSKIIIENSSFLSTYNAKYYAAALTDPTIRNDIGRLKAIASSIQKRVEGKNFPVWYQEQFIFDFDPQAGIEIFYKMWIDMLYVFNRHEFGVSPISDTAVSWTYADAQGSIIGSGTDMTTVNGLFILPQVVGYQGRMSVSVVVHLAAGDISETFLRYAGAEEGIFGIVSGNGGYVKAGGYEVPVVNGAFSIPELNSFYGKIRVTYVSETGATVSKYVTKDVSPIYTSFAK